MELLLLILKTFKGIQGRSEIRGVMWNWRRGGSWVAVGWGKNLCCVVESGAPWSVYFERGVVERLLLIVYEEISK